MILIEVRLLMIKIIRHNKKKQNEINNNNENLN